MSFASRIKRLLVPMQGPSDSELAALEKRAGQMTAWYDQRGVVDGYDPEQPQAGYADAHLRMVDPNWRPR